MDDRRVRPNGWTSLNKGIADTSLVRRIAAGDRQALASLYERFRLPLYRYLLQLTPDAGLAEEILQDTFVGAWKAAGSFEGRSSVQTWLIGIARRQAHNVLRRQRLPVADETELEQAIAQEDEPEAWALAESDRAAVARSLSRLSPLHREVLILTFFHGLSYPELAQVLGVPVGTVKSRLSHAKAAIRALLAPVAAHR